jgi:hypothetical protein
MGSRRSGFKTRFAVVAAVVGVVAGTAWAGLVSVGPAAAVVVNVPCSGPGGGTPGLIGAINAANAGGGGIINLATGCTYVLTQVDNTADIGNEPSPNGLPAITSPITLNGFFATIERSSAAPPFRILFVSATGRVTLNNLTITGGLANDSGGGAANQGDLTLNASRVTGNAAGFSGGGIFNDPGPNTSPEVPTLNNPGPNGGPAVLILNNSRVDHNTTTFGSNDFGGGILTTGTTTLNTSEVDANHATFGGGIFNFGGAGPAGNSPGSLTLNTSRLHDNTAAIGAGMQTSGSEVVRINAGQIINNTATAGGGGIFTDRTTVILNAALVTSNTPNNCRPLNSIPGCIN